MNRAETLDMEHLAAVRAVFLPYRKKKAQKRPVNSAEPGTPGDRARSGFAADKPVKEIAACRPEDHRGRFPEPFHHRCHFGDAQIASPCVADRGEMQ